MKRIPFILLICMCACKKQPATPPEPPPTPRYYSVHAGIETSVTGTTPGTIFPQTSQVLQGATVTFYVSPDKGWRVSKVVAIDDNNKPVAFTIEELNKVTFTEVHSQFNVAVTLTDSLTTDSIASLRKILIDSTWHDRVAYWRPYIPNNPRPWKFLGDYSDCQQLSYYNFYDNGDYIEHINVGSCDGNPPSIARVKWELSYNGQSLVFTNDSTTSITLIDTLTTTKFGYIFSNYQGKGKDYKIVATP